MVTLTDLRLLMNCEAITGDTINSAIRSAVKEGATKTKPASAAKILDITPIGANQNPTTELDKQITPKTQLIDV